MVRTFIVACSMVNRRLGDSCSTVRAYYGARVRGPKPRTGSKSAVERGTHRALYKVPRNLIFIRQVCVHGSEYCKRRNKSALYIPHVTSKFYEYDTRRPARDVCTTSLKIFHKSRRHLKIPGARNVTWRKFYTEDPQFCGHPCTLLYLALSALSM